MRPVRALRASAQIHVTVFVSLCLLGSGCAELPTEPVSGAAPENVTSTQRLVDEGQPNWMVVGGNGLVEMIGGTDGEPDDPTGRFALEGSAIVDAESGSGRWVVIGPNTTQPLDDDGLRLTDARDALSGDEIGFIEPGPTGWLIGGANGRLQLLDAQGEPTNTEIQVLSNSTITAAAHNGNAWLIGGANGNVVATNTALPDPAQPAGNTADAGKAITAIVADPSGTLNTPAFLAFTTDSAVPVGAVGAPQTPVNVLSSGEITAAEFAGGDVYIGTSDGRVGVAGYGATPNFGFTNVLNGGAVTRLVSNGSEWIALGDNGQAQRFDNNGTTLGPAVQVSEANRALVGAHWTGTNWRIVVGEIGFVAFVDEQLAAPRELTPVLGGAQINAAAASGNGILVVGSGGNVQVLDELGNAMSQPVSVTTNDLHAVAWNGENWLVAGDAGTVQVVGPDGQAVGSSTTQFGGGQIRFVTWSGEFFLAGGEGGNIQVLRADGTQSAAPYQVAGATEMYAARWSGEDWLVVGSDGTNGVFTRVIATDASAQATVLDQMGPLRAVDFNGLEFLVGGDDGLVQRVSAQGMPVNDPVDVLTGFGIRDLYFNGANYIVVGEFGAVRRLGQDYLPLRTPISVIDRADASTVLWTTPRGFANGPCITDELCYAGPCVGGLNGGQCCDAACDRPCESCFQDDTGEPDGTCAPVVAGKQPPPKEGAAGCQRQSEQTCGLTGACDGAGECEFYGAEVQCADAICSLGQFTPVASCGGTGTCAVVEEQDCAPYAGCTIDGCVTSCNADQDCVDGFVCEDSACVEEEEDTGPPPGDEPEDEGCCSTTGSSDGGVSGVALLLGLLLAARRR